MANDKEDSSKISAIQIKEKDGNLKSYVIELEPNNENLINLKPIDHNNDNQIEQIKNRSSIIIDNNTETKLKRSTSLPDVTATAIAPLQQTSEPNNFKKKKKLLKNFKPFENFKFYFANHKPIDVEKLSKAFNSYSSKKTYATGFFNLALVTTNFSQIKFLITINNWIPLNIVLVTFVGISIVLQFSLAILLIFLVKQGEFVNDEKRDQLIRNNNWATVIVLTISIINIFINVFISL
jgi:hypothetical protein